MNIAYVSNGGAGPTYEIEADRHGNFTIRCGGRVVKRVTSVTSYIGKPRWGSRKLELAAIEEAKALIEAHDRQQGEMTPRAFGAGAVLPDSGRVAQLP